MAHRNWTFDLWVHEMPCGQRFAMQAFFFLTLHFGFNNEEFFGYITAEIIFHNKIVK